MKLYELKEVMDDNEHLDLHMISYSRVSGKFDFHSKRYNGKTYGIPDYMLDSNVNSMYITAGGSFHIELLKIEEL